MATKIYIGNSEIAGSQGDLTGYVEKTSISTSLSSSSTDSQVASAKCVYDALGNIETLLSQI